KELAEALSFKLRAAPEHEQALARPITVKLDAGSPYERLDAVCKQVGLYPTFPDFFDRGGEETAVVLKQLPRSSPATCAGPFLVEIDELSEFVPHASGLVALRVQAAKLPPAVLDFLGGPTPPFTLLEATDAKGRDLRDLANTFTRNRMFRL